ncbi:MAG: hypothetical protein HKO03_04595 [Acidimicrobiia bacterium]|nr:hypothetical protein [Acidimicrobiia bacterium]NNL49122.1 hypothetical protein [Acidimicrobiia bacterium]
MLKFLSMRAVSLSATMVLGVSGMALAASHVAEEVPVDPVPVIEEATVIAAEESAPTEEAEVAKEEVVAEDQLPCLDCSESASVDILELPAEEVECQEGNHGKTVSHAARNGGDVKAAAQSDCGKKHQEEDPPTNGDTAVTVGTAAEASAAVETEVQVGSEGPVESDDAVSDVEPIDNDRSGRDKAKSDAGSNGQGHGKDKKNK